MWSHYSDDHRGISLEFGTDNHLFSSALQVQYCETYPVLNFADDDEHTALLALLTKAAAWRYEQEYRLIAQDQAAALGWGSLITAGNLLTLPPGALQAVIVGCSTPPDMRAEIRKIVQASSRDIAVKQAVRVPNRYELAIDPL